MTNSTVMYLQYDEYQCQFECLGMMALDGSIHIVMRRTVGSDILFWECELSVPGSCPLRISGCGFESEVWLGRTSTSLEVWISALSLF